MSKTFVFDIDGTICEVFDSDYESAKPIPERIEIVNWLFELGCEIIFHTARGMGRTGNDSDAAYELFYELTKGQLEEWGVKFNQLYLGKPSGDFYIDDKAISDKGFFNALFKKK